MASENTPIIAAPRPKIPVTVLTGFLGSGKTTLLNRILSEHHGQRIAVIENEFGEIGVDQALVISADEEIFEMNNGCICCTVRGDLIRVLNNLMKRRDKFDRVLIETTGLADPGPVAQTFFMDEDIQEDFCLDGIITMVDAKHIELHLEESKEAQEQVAFGDVIVLNKTDLVEEAALSELEQRLRSMNGMARVHRSEMARVPLHDVLDIGGFDLERALEYKPTFLEPEYPFEWGALFNLAPGTSTLHLSDGPDATMSVVLLPLLHHDAATLDAAAEQAFRLFAAPPQTINPGAELTAGTTHWRLQLTDRGDKSFPCSVPTAGTYALFTQHLPEEFALRLCPADGSTLHPRTEKCYTAGHSHDDTVTSVGLEVEGTLDQKRINDWLGTLLREKGADIFRMKGILAIHGKAERFVFQGVHMLFTGQPDRPWGKAEKRLNQLVFIGRNLDRDALTRGLLACLKRR